MLKKILLNLLIFVITWFFPLCYFDLNQKDSRVIDTIQIPVFSILLVGATLLTYSNHKYRKQAQEKKWVWLIFEIVGYLGIFYSAGILWLLYEFRNGIGF